MPTIVGILAFMSRKNSIQGLSEPEECSISGYFYSYEHLKFHAQLSWAWKKIYNLGLCSAFQWLLHCNIQFKTYHTPINLSFVDIICKYFCCHCYILLCKYSKISCSHVYFFFKSMLSSTVVLFSIPCTANVLYMHAWFINTCIKVYGLQLHKTTEFELFKKK